VYLFNFLVAFATGTRADELREHPDDRGQYTTLAFLNLLTSISSGLMMMVALFLARGGRITGFAPVGALFGTFIFFVDRFLIAPRGTSKRAGLMTAFRVAVSITLGSVVAQPALVLLYDSDIARYFAAGDQTVATAEADTVAASLDTQIVALDARVSRERDATLNSRTMATDLRQTANAELDSSVGGRPPGPGPEWRKKDAAARTAEEAATSRESALGTLEAQLSGLQSTRQTAASTALATSLGRHHGLSDRLAAVDKVVSLKQRVLINLLLVLLDAAVSIFKMMMGRTGIDLLRERRTDDAALADIEALPFRLDANRRREERLIALAELQHEDRVAVATARSRRWRDVALARIRLLGF
jgi:Domain of unknown function (DUF4407)